jgi:broad specificity phosphatase PhoE
MNPQSHNGGSIVTRIILVRHGQTAWNVGASSAEGERFRGRIDLPLNERGRAQAQALDRRLADEPIAAIYASPLQRAMETAEPTARRLGLTVQPLEGILDISYGDWQEHPHSEVAQLYPALYRQWLQEPHLVQIPGGESLEEVRDRAMAALHQVMARHQDQMILAAAHQVVNKVLVCAMLGLDNSHFWRIRQDNGCLNIFDYQEGFFTALLINDTCHLG